MAPIAAPALELPERSNEMASSTFTKESLNEALWGQHLQRNFEWTDGVQKEDVSAYYLSLLHFVTVASEPVLKAYAP
jgi:hypothetical protein